MWLLSGGTDFLGFPVPWCPSWFTWVELSGAVIPLLEYFLHIRYVSTCDMAFEIPAQAIVMSKYEDSLEGLLVICFSLLTTVICSSFLQYMFVTFFFFFPFSFSNAVIKMPGMPQTLKCLLLFTPLKIFPYNFFMVCVFVFGFLGCFFFFSVICSWCYLPTLLT